MRKRLTVRRVVGAAVAATVITVAALLLRGPVKDAIVSWRNPCKTILTEGDVSRALGEPVKVHLAASRYFCDARFESVGTRHDLASFELSVGLPRTAGWWRARMEESGAKVDSLSFGDEGLLSVGGDEPDQELDAHAWTSTCNHEVGVHIHVSSASSAAPRSPEGSAEREKTQFEVIELARIANDRLAAACIIGE